MKMTDYVRIEPLSAHRALVPGDGRCDALYLPQAKRLAVFFGVVMRSGSRVLVTIIVLVVGIYLLRPTIDRLLFAETQPRAVEARGNLADFEKLTVDIFQRAAPSVVQVAGRAAAASPEMLAEQE